MVMYMEKKIHKFQIMAYNIGVATLLHVVFNLSME